MVQVEHAARMYQCQSCRQWFRMDEVIFLSPDHNDVCWCEACDQYINRCPEEEAHINACIEEDEKHRPPTEAEFHYALQEFLEARGLA